MNELLNCTNALKLHNDKLKMLSKNQYCLRLKPRLGVRIDHSMRERERERVCRTCTCGLRRCIKAHQWRIKE